MKALRFTFVALGLVVGGLLLGGCSEGERPEPTTYRAELEPVGGSGVHGAVEIGVKGDSLGVSVQAEELEPDTAHAQHVHQDSTCEDPGAPLLALDDSLSQEPSDPTGGGDRFPVATADSTIEYRAEGSKKAIEETLGGDLDLAHRSVVVHRAGDPIGGPAACGALNLAGK